MQFLWSYLKNYKSLLALTLILAAINQIFSLLDPQIFRLLVDNYASKVNLLTSSQFYSGVLLLLLGTVGVALVSRIAKNFQDYYVNVIVQRLGTKMYADSVEHSFGLPYAVFEDQRSGEYLQKLQKARTDAQTLIQSSISILYLALVGILFVIIYAFTVHWLIGLIYSLIIPLLGTATFLISRKIKAVQQTIIKQTASLAGSTTETIRNVELVKSLGLEHQEINRLNEVNEQILQLELKKIKMVRKLSFIQGTLVNALRSGLMFIMLFLMFQHQVTLGQFFTLLFYSFFIFQPLGELGTLATNYQEAQASMDRLNEILSTPTEKIPENPTEIDTLENIKFSDVTFTYPSNPKPALSDITLDANRGQTIAFAGPSGSGKTTMIKLLVGLYKPTKGHLIYNNADSNNINFTHLRSRVGLVAQDTQLFAGTIRENLLFAKPDASDEDCLEAIKQAAAESVINRTGEGLNTRIGEGGLKLSGGEKQRIAIARALLRKPDLLIFDEATSSLDSLTEEEITKTIKEIRSLRANMLTVIVAHRLSTIAHADKIYVFEKSKIVEAGTHDQLINNKGLYFALWRQQQASTEN